MILDSDLELPESLDCYGGEDFEGVFISELDMISYDLPIQRFCNHGGWPDDESLEIEVKDISRKGNLVTITVKISFTELVSTGCADIQRHQSGFGELEVTLDLDQKRAFYLYDSDCD